MRFFQTASCGKTNIPTRHAGAEIGRSLACWSRSLACLIPLLIAPNITAAQGWEALTFDDGSFFSAVARGQGLAFECGGRSPRGLDPMVTGNVEPSVTAPYTFNLVPGNKVIGERGASFVSDVTLQTGQTGVYLPALAYNEMLGAWEQPISMTDPLIIALRAEARTVINSPGHGVTEIPMRGLSAAMDQVIAYCGGRWALTGHPVPPMLQGGAAPSARPSNPATTADHPLAMAQADIMQACGGGQPQLSANALQRGDFDGDRQPDILLFWRDVTCLSGQNAMNGPGAGNCGASACSATAYLSSQAAKRDDIILALSANAVPRGDGGADIVTVPSLAVCQNEFGTTDCAHRFRWNGYEFARVR